MANLDDWLDYFCLCDGVVTWADAEAIAAARSRAGRTKLRRFPFGRIAGCRPVHGRGMYVKCGAGGLLTGDIAAALRDGYAWPWDTDSTGWADNRERIRPDRIHAAIRLDGSRLVWARDVREGLYKAGSPVTGAPVWRGREDRVVQCDGVSFLYADAVAYLRDGKFPFDAGDGWD